MERLEAAGQGEPTHRIGATHRQAWSLLTTVTWPDKRKLEFERHPNEQAAALDRPHRRGYKKVLL